MHKPSNSCPINAAFSRLQVFMR